MDLCGRTLLRSGVHGGSEVSKDLDNMMTGFPPLNPVCSLDLSQDTCL